MDARVSFPNNIFPLGTHVYREPHQDLDELMADLPLLKELGFNMIKIQEHWAIDEPRVPLALDGGYFDRLRKYVEAGGMLICEACPGRFDKRSEKAITVRVPGGSISCLVLTTPKKAEKDNLNRKYWRHFRQDFLGQG